MDAERGMPIPDEALFVDYRNGNGTALETLVRRYEKPLYHFLLRRTGDVAQAEDVFQETWIHVMRGRHTFQESRSFRTWLYAVAANAARRVRVRPEVLAAEAVSNDPPAAPLERREMSERIRSLIDSLPEAQREAFLLFEYEGMSYPEISQVLGRPVGTLKSQMHYALKTVRAGLEQLERAGA